MGQESGSADACVLFVGPHGVPVAVLLPTAAGRPRLDLPRRFHAVARLTMRASTSSTPSNIVQRMEFDDHEDHQKNWNDDLERYR
jgi:hypothetical protein